MKALLLATYTIIQAGQPHTINSTDQIDAYSCRDTMVSIVDNYGLKNHVYSSGPSYMRARDKNVTLSVTCKTLEK